MLYQVIHHKFTAGLSGITVYKPENLSAGNPAKPQRETSPALQIQGILEVNPLGLLGGRPLILEVKTTKIIKSYNLSLL